MPNWRDFTHNLIIKNVNVGIQKQSLKMQEVVTLSSKHISEAVQGLISIPFGNIGK